MVRDCCEHFDPNTQGLIQKLITNSANCDVQAYIDNFCTGDRDELTANILRVEAALEEDVALHYWQARYENYMDKYTREAYAKYRAMPGDVEHNIDPQTIQTFKVNEANGI